MISMIFDIAWRELSKAPQPDFQTVWTIIPRDGSAPQFNKRKVQNNEHSFVASVFALAAQPFNFFRFVKSLQESEPIW